MRNHRSQVGCISFTIILSLIGCSHIEWRAQFLRPSDHARIDSDAAFLKCHAADGGVYVLSSWRFATESGVILGTGLRYDKNRNLLERDKQVIPYEHVVLLETNQPRKVVETDRVLAMGVMTLLSVILSMVVLAKYDNFFL